MILHIVGITAKWTEKSCSSAENLCVSIWPRLLFGCFAIACIFRKASHAREAWKSTRRKNSITSSPRQPFRLIYCPFRKRFWRLLYNFSAVASWLFLRTFNSLTWKCAFVKFQIDKEAFSVIYLPVTYNYSQKDSLTNSLLKEIPSSVVFYVLLLSGEN